MSSSEATQRSAADPDRPHEPEIQRLVTEVVERQVAE
jgi:hypothetical protein